jgi:hypothetical protein
MAKQQGLPHYVLGGALRYRVSEVEAWLQQHHAGDTRQPRPEMASTPISTSVELRSVADERGAA